MSLEKEKETFLCCVHLLRKAGAWYKGVSCRGAATMAKKMCKKKSVMHVVVVLLI